MATAQIGFKNDQQSGDAELAGASPFAVNVVVDAKGAVRRRPGISAWSGFPTTIPEASQVDGIASFKGDIYYVNSRRRIHKVSAGVDTQVTTSADVNSYLAGTSRPIFAETKYRLAIAGGDVPQKVESGVSARLGGSPPKSTHIMMLASRLFSDDLTSSATIGQIRFSTPGSTGEELWDPLNETEAEARPDAIVALRENTNEAFAFGETTLQVFIPDPVTILAPGRTRSLGCSAAYSVVRVEDNFVWLDNQRRFILSDGRSYQELSQAIGQTLDRMGTVSDAIGFRFNYDQFDCVNWIFPTDGRTFSWQQGGGWAQWHSWTQNQGYTPFAIKSHCFHETANIHLVGLASGQIAKLDPQASTDLGTPIKAEVWTGFENRGTDAFKSCECLRLVLKRGQTSGTAPVLRISWRDDLGAFNSPIVVSLGTTGDYVVTKELRSLGTYRRRQWKFEMTDAAELVLAGAEEVYTIDTEGAN